MNKRPPKQVGVLPTFGTKLDVNSFLITSASTAQVCEMFLVIKFFGFLIFNIIKLSHKGIIIRIGKCIPYSETRDKLRNGISLK